MQLLGILIERRRPSEHQQVAEQVRDDEPEQARACDGHDVLSPQRSVENALDEIHRLGDVSYKSAPSVK